MSIMELIFITLNLFKELLLPAVQLGPLNHVDNVLEIPVVGLEPELEAAGCLAFQEPLDMPKGVLPAIDIELGAAPHLVDKLVPPRGSLTAGMMVVFWCGCGEAQKIPQYTSITGPNVFPAEPVQQERHSVLVPHLHLCPNPMPLLALFQCLVVDAQAPVRGRGTEIDGLFVSICPHIPTGLADIPAMPAMEGHTPVVQDTL